MNNKKPTVEDLIKALQKVDPKLELWGMDDETCKAYQRCSSGVKISISRYHHEMWGHEVWEETENIYEDEVEILETKEVFMIF